MISENVSYDKEETLTENDIDDIIVDILRSTLKNFRAQQKQSS